jgi:CheY-like chemotaxis protein
MRWGASVQHAADGPTAFAQLTSGDAVDLVVYDTPRSDVQTQTSVEATVRMLRASGTPVLALLPLHAHASRLDGGGALRKPLRPSRFARALARMLNGDADRSGLVPREEVPVAATGRKLRVLVVEDNAVNQRVMEQMMTRLGHRPDLVSNGLEAVDALKRQAYDLVFMDLQMPELDGISATQRIRAMEAINQPRIVALTAGAMEGTRERCLDAGMDDYLAKPIRLDDLRPVLAATPVLDAGDDDSAEALRADVLAQLSHDIGAEGPDDPFVQELVEQFIEQASVTLETMQTLSATSRYAELAQEAHRLKGGARTIGAEAFARACALVEAQAERQAADPEAAPEASPDIPLAEHVERLTTTLAAVRTAANHHFPS